MLNVCMITNTNGCNYLHITNIKVYCMFLFGCYFILVTTEIHNTPGQSMGKLKPSDTNCFPYSI